jgi:hypothetical protein
MKCLKIPQYLNFGEEVERTGGMGSIVKLRVFMRSGSCPVG